MNKIIYTIIFCLFIGNNINAQTDIDAIMMPKHNFCGGIMYGNSSWKNYWEGTFKRDNQNLGTVSNNSISLMGNYGVTDKLNILFNIPYVQTKASAGTLKGYKGFQDFSLTVKYMPVETDLGNATFSVYTIGSVSTPITNYVADYLPLSIGLQSKTATARLLIDYQLNNFFATISSAYIARKNIFIDRTAYYTTEMHYSNEVSMPDATNINVRVGYRSRRLIAEAIFDQFTTQGGFDIRKNELPFPSNKMNATKIGVNAKYTFDKKIAGLSAVGGANFVVAGRNIGQTSAFMIGAFYQMDWSKKKKTDDTKKATPASN
jgi:hypothetical protein